MGTAAVGQDARDRAVLPEVVRGRVGADLVPTTSGRKLHAFLRVGRDFTTWLKGRIAEYAFVEGVDFVIDADLRSPVSGSAKARPQRVAEYHLTTDMAKELAMVENNDQGHAVRRHYIECERRLQIGSGGSTAEIVDTFRHYRDLAGLIGMDVNQAALGAARATERAHGINPLVEIAATHLLAPQQDRHINPTEIGKRTKIGAAKIVNKLLERHGYQIGVRDPKGKVAWEPTEKGRPLAVILDTGKSQGGAPIRQLRWSADIVPALQAAIAAGGNR